MIKNPLSNNKKEKNTKTKKLTYINIIISIFAVMAFILTFCISCSLTVDTKETVKQLSDAAIEELPEEEIAELIEETVPEVDYQNATVAAEMEGAIPSFLCTNMDNYIKIKITNKSDFTWRNKRPGVVRIGYHYYGQDVDYVDYDRTQRTVLPKEVGPGETVTVLVLINDIENPGTYVIQIDPVLEGNQIPENNFWFSSKDVEMIEGIVFFEKCGN